MPSSRSLSVHCCANQSPPSGRRHPAPDLGRHVTKKNFRSRASSVTTDEEGMDRTVLAAMCLHGAGCREGLNCPRGHTDVHRQFFSEKKQLREREWMAPCGFCAAGCCWYGQNCLRSIRSRFSETAYGNQRAPAAESESDYASAESGSDSGNESADEGGMTGAMGCGAEGAVFDRALTPFLFEDFTEVVKGWKPSVGAADAEFRGFGEPPIFWMLNVVQVPVPPDCSGGGQCEVDELGFRFKQSKGAVMSQKAQRRLANQKKVEVVWAGPAVVCEQRAVRRVSIGHRGATVRKSLFEDSDEGSSGGTNDGSSAMEGGCSRAETAARQRSAVIRRDRAEVRRRADAKSGAAGLAVAVKVRSTSPRQKYADRSRVLVQIIFIEKIN